jgi:flagellar basal body-associated protein FliL
MPETSRAEIYFIAAMFFLIIILCTAAMYLFFTTYRKEMRAKEERERLKEAAKAEARAAQNGNTEQDHTV